MEDHKENVQFKNHIDASIENYKEYKKEGEIILSIQPVYMDSVRPLGKDNEGNSVWDHVKNKDAAHAVTVTGVAKDGRLIVSSWGREYYVDLNDYKNGGAGFQVVQYGK